MTDSRMTSQNEFHMPKVVKRGGGNDFDVTLNQDAGRGALATQTGHRQPVGDEA